MKKVVRWGRVEYVCASNSHYWSKAEDAEKCCNGWIPKWIPGFMKEDPTSKFRRLSLVPESDNERFKKYETELPFQDKEEYVEPWKRDLKQADQLDWDFAPLVTLFLIGNLKDSEGFNRMDNSTLIQHAHYFMSFMTITRRARIPPEEVDDTILRSFLEQNSRYDNVAEMLWAVFRAWRHWIAGYILEIIADHEARGGKGLPRLP